MRYSLGDAEGCYLRFVFDGAAVSLALATDATIEDIARILGTLPEQRYGEPGAIDITLRDPTRGRRRFSKSIGAWPRIVGSQYSATAQFVLADRWRKENERADSGYDAG